MSQGFVVTNFVTNAQNVLVADDTTTNATVYPTWVTANSGNLPVKVSSTKISFNPSTGILSTVGIAFNPTTGGVVGTPTNDNASAGYVGEFVSSVIASGSATSLVNTTTKNVTTISLTAGDWDVIGNVFFNVSSASQGVSAWCSLTSASFPDSSLRSQVTASISNSGAGLTTPLLRVSVNTTTTVYLSGIATFVAGTVTACGGIFARRVR